MAVVEVVALPDESAGDAIQVARISEIAKSSLCHKHPADAVLVCCCAQIGVLVAARSHDAWDGSLLSSRTDRRWGYPGPDVTLASCDDAQRGAGDIARPKQRLHSLSSAGIQVRPGTYFCQ